MAALKRTHNFNIRLSDEEHAMLVAVAGAKGLSASDFVRQCVRETYAEKFGDKPPRKPRKRGKR